MKGSLSDGLYPSLITPARPMLQNPPLGCGVLIATRRAPHNDNTHSPTGQSNLVVRTSATIPAHYGPARLRQADRGRPRSAAVGFGRGEANFSARFDAPRSLSLSSSPSPRASADASPAEDQAK